MTRTAQTKARRSALNHRRSRAATRADIQTIDSPAAPRAAVGMEPIEVMTRLLKLNNRLLVPFAIHLEKRHEITLNEFRMLMTIGRIGATAAHELSEHTGINAMGVSRAVAALRRHGRVAVQTDPNNRRRKHIQLTQKGRALYERMTPASNKVAQYLFAALRPDEIMAFDHFVKTLTARLEATDEQGRSLFLESTQPPDE